MIISPMLKSFSTYPSTSSCPAYSALIERTEKFLEIQSNQQKFEFETFKSLLRGVLAADKAVNAGIGFLNTEERKYVETILKSISNEQT